MLFHGGFLAVPLVGSQVLEDRGHRGRLEAVHRAESLDIVEEIDDSRDEDAVFWVRPAPLGAASLRSGAQLLDARRRIQKAVARPIPAAIAVCGSGTSCGAPWVISSGSTVSSE